MVILPGIIPSRTLRLDTSEGRHIDNAQYFEISAFEHNQFSETEGRAKDATLRLGPSARYNCHGLTFASRRTSVANEAIPAILEDDGYVEVPRDQILCGDVLVYYDSDGAPDHSAIVVSEPSTQMKVPKVVSKWGKFSELIHWANDCPYPFGNAKYYRLKKR